MGKHAEVNAILSLVVAATNPLYSSKQPERAIPPRGVPASAAQYRCLERMACRIRYFLSGIKAAASEAARCPDARIDVAAFASGEDFDNFMKSRHATEEDAFCARRVRSPPSRNAG